MADAPAGHTPPPQDVVAYDRPAGQQDSEGTDRPHFRRATRIFVALLVIAGVAIWAGYFLERKPITGDQATSAVILLAFAIVSARIPLLLAYKQDISFDVTVLVMTSLLLPPHIGLAVIVVGYVAGYGLRYRFRFILDCPHNASVHGLSLSLASLWFGVLGIDPPSGAESLLVIIGAGAAVALIALLVTRALDAVVINLESHQPIRQILRDSTVGMQTAEQAMLGAMIALGIIGAILARESPWALLLLLVPAFSMWLALRQYVETRHRIEASLATAQRVAGIGSLDWDLERGDIRWSDILFHILGYAPGAVQPTADVYINRVHLDDRSRVLAGFHAAAEGRQIEVDHRVLLASDDERFFNLKFNGVRDRRGQVKRIVGTVHDVTDRTLLEERLHFQAYHDPLTLLPNRAMFLNRLEQSFARYHRSGSIALLFLDLDRFKMINDTLGHDAGDQLLRVVGKRLETCIRPNDVVARLGGDEFIILLDNVPSDAEAIAVADRVVAEINQPLTLPGNRDVLISTSIGIIRPGPEHATGADLLRDADTALYRAKALGRNRLVFYEASMGAESHERMSLEEDLRTALDLGHMSLVYQPRVDLASGRVAMVEALVRWTHPERGEVPPVRFIPIAEETGQIEAIGNWILRTAIAEAATWTRVLNPSPTLSLNITSKQLHDPGFATQLAASGRAAGIGNGQIRLEVPESVVMKNVDGAIIALGRLQQMGARVAIDDFGAGQSSLPSLRRLPIDSLQLDRQFVTEIGVNREATTVAQAVIGLAHGLGLRVVAAGVERQEQAEQLASFGCEYAQGNYFCAPVPGTELLAFLIRNEQRVQGRPRHGDPPNIRRLNV